MAYGARDWSVTVNYIGKNIKIVDHSYDGREFTKNFINNIVDWILLSSHVFLFQNSELFAEILEKLWD